MRSNHRSVAFTIITQTFDRITLCLKMKVKFSDPFLVSDRINERQEMQKYTCCHLCVSCLPSGSQGLCNSFLSLYESTWGWVNVNLASQTIILCFPINPHWKKTRDQNTARANQSASQDFRLATNQHLKSVDLRNCSKKQHQQNKKQTEPDLRLGLQLLAWAK